MTLGTIIGTAVVLLAVTTAVALVALGVAADREGLLDAE